MRIVIVDDDPPRLELLAGAITRACPGADVQATTDAAPDDPLCTAADAVVLGPACADRPPGIDLLHALHARRPTLPILVVSTRDGAEPAVAALKAGATDYVVLGEHGEVGTALARLLQRDGGGPRRPPAVAGRDAGDHAVGLIGRSAAIQHVRELMRVAARTEAHVLVEGETGTGKEVVARAIHTLGRRAGGPFVPVNCAAVPEALAESEFFGHTRGAFTGALHDRPGLLQLADHGTLFLDEVEDLSPALQAKLLRVVQDREVRPVGGSTFRRVDVRLVAACNRDLARMVEEGTFRRDLYYRLRVLAIHLPPLRQRREDLPLLIEHFIARFNRAQGTALVSPPLAALRPLLEHAWPGNVRELENALEALLIHATASGEHLGAVLHRRGPAAFTGDERARIVRILDEHRWNRQRAATALGISRVTLWRRMERHGIRDPLVPPARETA